MRTPNPNECNSTITSVTEGYFPLPPYVETPQEHSWIDLQIVKQLPDVWKKVSFVPHLSFFYTNLSFGTKLGIFSKLQTP